MTGVTFIEEPGNVSPVRLEITFNSGSKETCLVSQKSAALFLVEYIKNSSRHQLICHDKGVSVYDFGEISCVNAVHADVLVKESLHKAVLGAL